jgi:homospermidine synthase
MATKNVYVLGFGSVARALLIRLRGARESGTLDPIAKVFYFAPEIPSEGAFEGFENDDVFTFNHCHVVDCEAAVPKIFDLFKANGAKEGDILVEVACRVDTLTMWKAAKANNMHFCNTGYDVWGDQVLDLEGLDNMSKDPVFEGNGTGKTSIFGFGMNPGLVNHFITHGLKLATGITDPLAASAEFGLKGVIFSERDTQWAQAGTEAEAYLKANQQNILFNTWSPGNFVVETKESTLLWPGMPNAVKEVTCDDPTFVSWVPSGPIVGFAAVESTPSLLSLSFCPCGCPSF